jgi:hypothetical protein
MGTNNSEINIRHDAVVNALYTHATQSGAAAVKVHVRLSMEDGRRQDLQIPVFVNFASPRCNLRAVIKYW